MASCDTPINPDEDVEDDAINYPGGWHWTTDAAHSNPRN